MNIGQAKEEIKRTINAYLQKDENDKYIMEERFCRPVLLMGAPGIGKTQIVRQIADEMNISLVSYTITHHTRQSAIGLPVVEHKSFGEDEYVVTNYTMSEIIACIYENIEKSGNDKGILFLDEINCVSETLLPTMLQFLQYKTFGTHKIPRGFVIICAGNPIKYNRSAREFDIVTLDRLKTIDIEVDFDTFYEYANNGRMYGAILAFLDIKKDYFYRIRNEGEDVYFVTARAWEDLSEMICAYERLGYKVTYEMIREYICDDEIAESFFEYYTLYEKYTEKFALFDVLSGKYTQGGKEVADAPFDERLSLLHLLFDALSKSYLEYEDRLASQLALKNNILEKKELLSEEKFSREKDKFECLEDERQAHTDTVSNQTTRVFEFLDRTFGEGQEMVMFLNMLMRNSHAKRFLADIGNAAYAKYSKRLLLKERNEELKREILRLEGV